VRTHLRIVNVAVEREIERQLTGCCLVDRFSQVRIEQRAPYVKRRRIVRGLARFFDAAHQNQAAHAEAARIDGRYRESLLSPDSTYY